MKRSQIKIGNVYTEYNFGRHQYSIKAICIDDEKFHYKYIISNNYPSLIGQTYNVALKHVEEYFINLIYDEKLTKEELIRDIIE